MGETLTQQRRVSDEGFRVVSSVGWEETANGEWPFALTVPPKEAPANSVPAAAVIRRVQALFGFTGRKARRRPSIGCESPGLNPGSASETGRLEYGRGKRNSWCSGEMRRYQEEHRWRRRLPGPILTLRREGVGSKQD